MRRGGDEGVYVYLEGKKTMEQVPVSDEQEKGTFFISFLVFFSLFSSSLKKEEEKRREGGGCCVVFLLLLLLLVGVRMRDVEDSVQKKSRT